MIEISQAHKNFGRRTALHPLDLQVAAGEIFGLLGHNGAGKSTLIGMMLGQVWPTQGFISICGHDVARERHRALQRVGAIFETPVFYDYLSGWRNLEILSQYSAPTPAPRIREVLEWVGLTGREHSKVHTYSHGMRTRLALAQALLPAPELLILDEPGDGLDPEGIHEMRQIILRLRKEMGLTIFLSSHLLSEVEQLCTRIAVLRQGRKIYDGGLEEAMSSRKWVRLRVSDFPAALQHLSSKGLVDAGRNGDLVRLSDGTATDRLVEELVTHGIRVFEIAQEARTLEQFYLELMHESDEPAGAPGKEARA
jgi:ABC-2 type transport system ATP-binding protein